MLRHVFPVPALRAVEPAGVAQFSQAEAEQSSGVNVADVEL
jgi:hypothetical protein